MLWSHLTLLVKLGESALEFIDTMLWAFDDWCGDGQSFAQTQVVWPSKNLVVRLLNIGLVLD